MTKPHRRDRTGVTAYRKRQPKLDETFKRAHRMMNEHILRHEEAMFKVNPDGTEEPRLWNPALAKQAEELVKSLNSVGQMYLKIMDAAKKAAGAMSFEEQLDAFAEWLEFELGPRHRQYVYRRVEAVEGAEQSAKRAAKNV